MKILAILLSILFIDISQAQTPIDENIQKEKKEHPEVLQTDPDARVFIIPNQKKTILTKEEIINNKKGYKRVHKAINKNRRIEKRKEKKTLRTQNKMFNKYIKQSKKKRINLKKESKEKR